MRPMYVPVRLAATVLAVTAAAGCMSVGNDAEGPVKPSHSAGRHGGAEPDGGPAGVGGGYMGAVGGDGKHGHGKHRGKHGASASASASASPSAGASASAPAGPAKPGRTVPPGEPAPTDAQPTAPGSPAPEPPAPSPEPPTPAPDPTVAEPSSSAHEETGGGTGAQLLQREPAPEAGVPV
ncbi:hypothetical protein [Streptomyces sp. DSM 15324]|uniref:hypothetical protein n=1 Tax=Streptomyces sp. DSM 15324 TaxID=1739111 RepID=UPI00074AF79A|nr:hypothetical protein [Streptomyces sp. DSM 15324]KUO08812.1 hypothetical protein AQJ58_29685 [Streptomyces sp. DSM 15324]